jgi:hypothetical protein
MLEAVQTRNGRSGEIDFWFEIDFVFDLEVVLLIKHENVLLRTKSHERRSPSTKKIS